MFRSLLVLITLDKDLKNFEFVNSLDGFFNDYTYYSLK